MANDAAQQHNVEPFMIEHPNFYKENPRGAWGMKAHIMNIFLTKKPHKGYYELKKAIEGKNCFRSEKIGESRYARLTVPAGIWFGFQGTSEGSSLLMNFADIPHDPEEVLHKEISEINYEWRTK